MRDADCVDFLQWALPRLAMRWPGFRKVRRQVCKRIARRIGDLGLPGLEAYRQHLMTHPEEWAHLDALCRITISRFYRDRGAFDALRRNILPRVAESATREGRPARAWSAGCASGEEPYTLRLAFDLEVARQVPGARLEILATDTEPAVLRRARAGCYARASLRELPDAWVRSAFEGRDDTLCLRAAYRHDLEFLAHDIRQPPIKGPFDLILCRNLAFTYFAADLQLQVLEGLLGALRPGGFLMVGKPEQPPAHPRLVPHLPKEGIWQCVTGSADSPGG
jgi:chemotaxis protein methyltransferase CheR